MSDGNTIDQNDVEKLLAANKPGAASPPGDAPDAGPLNATIDQNDIEKLLAAGHSGGDTPPAGADHSAAEPSTIPPPPKPAAPKADDGNKMLGQSDIENLLKGTIGAPGAQAKAGAGIGMSSDSEEESVDEGVPQGDIDYLLRRAEEALESITSDSVSLTNGPPEVLEFQFPEFGGTTPNSEHATLDQISEVELDIKIELGRTNMYLEEILKLRKGSVVALDKIAGDAVDIYVNERLIARGEVLVLNDNFCVRIAELLAGAIPIE